MKKIFTLVLAFSMVVALCIGWGADAKADSSESGSTEESSASSATEIDMSDFVPVHIDYATFQTAGNVGNVILTTLEEKCNELMPGYVTITIYDNSSLLGAADIHDGVANGTAQMGMIQPDLQPARYPVSMLFEYPGIPYYSAEASSRIWTDFLKNHPDLKEYSDVKPIIAYGSGPGAIFSRDELADISDFKGKQIRAVGIAAKEIAAWGATPSTMEFSEVYEALRSGLVEGCFTLPNAGAIMKFQEITNYCLVTPLYNSVYVYAMNLDTWNSMPPAQQEVFMQAVDMANEEWTFKFGDECMKTLDNNKECFTNINLSFHEGEFLDQCTEACAPMLNEYASTIEHGDEYVAEIRELVEKYSEICSWEDYKALYNYE